MLVQDMPSRQGLRGIYQIRARTVRDEGTCNERSRVRVGVARGRGNTQEAPLDVPENESDTPPKFRSGRFFRSWRLRHPVRSPCWYGKDKAGLTGMPRRGERTADGGRRGRVQREVARAYGPRRGAGTRRRHPWMSPHMNLTRRRKFVPVDFFRSWRLFTLYQ